MGLLEDSPLFGLVCGFVKSRGFSDGIRLYRARVERGRFGGFYGDARSDRSFISSTDTLLLGVIKATDSSGWEFSEALILKL